MKDDIFFVWKVDKNSTIDVFRECLNYIKPRIQFTSEIEKGRVLNVADLAVKRMDDRFIMKVYRKEIHANKYINWRSNVPRKVLTGAMKTLIFRAYEFCYDCPVKVIDRVFGTFIFQKYRPDQAKSELKPQN